MTWLERDAPESLVWHASAKAAASIRAAKMLEQARLDMPDAWLVQLTDAALRLSKLSDPDNVLGMNDWDYREWVDAGGHMSIRAGDDVSALAVLIASLTRIPPKL